MNYRKSSVVLIGALILFIGLTIYQFYEKNNEKADVRETSIESLEELPRQGYQTPAFIHVNSQGEEIRIGKDMEKSVYINFWVSWCESCNIEAPDIQANYENLKDKIDFYAINMTNYDAKEKAEAFIERYNWTVPVLYDMEGELSTLYKVKSFPTSFLINKHGKVLDVINGIVEPKELTRKLNKLSNEM